MLCHWALSWIPPYSSSSSSSFSFSVCLLYWCKILSPDFHGLEYTIHKWIHALVFIVIIYLYKIYFYLIWCCPLSFVSLRLFAEYICVYTHIYIQKCLGFLQTLLCFSVTCLTRTQALWRPLNERLYGQAAIAPQMLQKTGVWPISLVGVSQYLK